MSKTAETIDETEDKKRSVREVVVEELKFLAGLLAFLFIFFNFVFGHYKIPSESMQPTLEVGDHLYVNKFAYGFSKHSLVLGLSNLPFLGDGRIFSKVPQRGDVAVFKNPKSGIVMIKRVVGLPGDEIETIDGRLYINGKIIERITEEELQYRDHANKMIVQVTRYKEQLPNEKKPHWIYEQGDALHLDTRGPYIIPQGKLFFMGDNRDNSVDSRAPTGPGFVPMSHLIGRAESMVYSLKKCKKEDGVTCPGRRFFLNL